MPIILAAMFIPIRVFSLSLSQGLTEMCLIEVLLDTELIQLVMIMQ